MKILNIGCGKETYGTDFVDVYPSRLGVIKLDIDREKLPYGDKVFDEVYSSCVLEHLTNPDNFMKESMRVLKKGGTLKLLTDNYSYVGYLFPIGSLYEHNYDGFGELDKHYMIFTRKHLENWAKKYGLEVVNIEYDYDHKASGFLKSMMRMILPKRYSYSRIWLIAKKNAL